MTHRVTETRRKSRPLLLYCLAMLWSVILLAIFAVANNLIVGVIGSVVALLTATGAIIGVIEPKPSWSNIFKWFGGAPPLWAVIAILSIDLLASIAWPALVYTQENRPIDVMSQISLDHNTRMLPEQGTATIEITINPWREILRITLQSSDHSPELGTCRPGLKFHITPKIAGNPGKSIQASPGESFTIRIPSLAKSISLGVMVSNARQGRNCAINLSVSDATLIND